MDEKIEGKLKETEGKLTGDKIREGQGKAEKTFGEAKEKVEDLGSDAERRWEDARESA